MADNVQVTQGIGTTMATDDVAGVQYPRIKVSVGADGSATDVSSANPMPVADSVGNASLAAIDAKIPALVGGKVPVDIGSASVSITGPVTVSNEVEIKNDAGNPVPVTGPLTDSQLRASAVPVSVSGVATAENQTNGAQKSQIVDSAGEAVDIVSLNTQLQATDKGIIANAIIHGITTGGGGGYVDVKVTPSGALVSEATIAALDPGILGQDTMANSLPVVIASNQSSIAVSGPLTDAQLRATAVPVSGALTDAELRATPVPVSGTVSTGLIQPLTDAQLRATAVPVSGPLTDVQLRASAVPVSGPLTDTQLRASAVPVLGPLTDAQLRASAVPVTIDKDRETLSVVYSVITAFTGASIGDVISATHIYDVSGASPTLVTSIWRNETLNTTLGSAPLLANLNISLSLTNSELRASAVSVSPNVTRGSGTTDANTQRVTLATDGQVATDIGSINTKTPALDNSKQPVIPSMTSGGNLSVTTAATGTNWTAFASQALKQLTVSNQTGTNIEFRQGGAGVGLIIPVGAIFTFFGITNANQIEARRVDTSNTQVTITARWES